MTTPYKILAAVIIAAILLASGYLFGVHTSTPKAENIAPAAAQSQPDGSVILERVPEASAPVAARPKASIPKGAVVERQISVTVQPTARLKLPPGASASTPVADTACPPVTVDLSLVRDGDGRRVIANSPDGTVTGGIDIPIEAGTIPVSHPWSAGISYGTDRSPGVYIERDVGRIQIGAELIRTTSSGVQGRLRAGWRW